MPTIEIAALNRFITEPQENLRRVTRWKNFQNASPPGRTQDTLQHTFGVSLLATAMLRLLEPYGAFKDPLLLLQAVLVHDMGEGILGYDTLYDDKSAGGDADEFVAFEQHAIAPLGKLSASFRRAFLLQFVDCGEEHRVRFPDYAQEIIFDLERNNPQEVVLFKAVENFDYVLYALESHARGVPGILEHVIPRQLPRLRQFVEVIPGFGEEIWTPECTAWCQQQLRDAA